MTQLFYFRLISQLLVSCFYGIHINVDLTHNVLVGIGVHASKQLVNVK